MAPHNVFFGSRTGAGLKGRFCGGILDVRLKIVFMVGENIACKC